MGNTGSISSDIKERPGIELVFNEASSSRPQLTRRVSQPILSKNPR